MNNTIENRSKEIIGSSKFLKVFIKKYIVYTLGISIAVSLFAGTGLISTIVSLFSTYFIFSWTADDILKKYMIKEEEIDNAKKKMLIFVFITNIFISIFDFLYLIVLNKFFGGLILTIISSVQSFFVGNYVVQIVSDLLSYIVITKLYSDLFDELFKGIKKKPFFKFVIEMVIVSVISVLLKLIVLHAF